LRGEASAKLADTFNAQGVASVTLLDDGRIILALLAAGSTAPDIIELRLDKPESVTSALDRLARTPAFFRPALGVTAVDVADVTGAVVVGLDPAMAASGLVAGDLIVAANGKPVPNVAALTAVLDDRKANDAVTLDVTAAGGAKKQVPLKTFMTPRLISMFEPGLLANRVLVDLRAQLAAAATGDPVLQSTIRLNLAVALGRSGDWNSARTELQRVQLPAGSGVGEGTVQYLIGVAADQLGNRTEAEAALKKAMAAGGLVTEDGPAVRELAEIKLAELQRPR
jgi:membrane-associated protease RseP (regulator of RpoE activity)